MTECPYCGTRLRKRAPKLELRGDELTPSAVPPHSPPPRAGAARRRAGLLADRPYAVIAAILIPAILLLVRVASPAINAFDLGAIVGPVEGDWWRYLAAPFIYPDIGYLFVASVGIAIFGYAVEERLGTIPTVVLILACGGLGMLAADGIETAFASSNDVLLAAGGNGIALGLLCAWGGDARGGGPGPSRRGRGADRRRGCRGRPHPAAARRRLRKRLRRLRRCPGGRGLRPWRRLGASRAHTRLTTSRLAFDKFISITPELHRYAVEHSSFRDGVIPDVERAGEEMGDLAAMQIAGDQAAFMTILVRAIGAHDALEVGTFLGYGALAIAAGCPRTAA